MIIVKLIKEFFIFLFRTFRFIIAKLWYKNIKAFNAVRNSSPSIVRILDLWAQRGLFYKNFYKFIHFYSEFLQVYSPIFWFRAVMVLMLYPIKLVFNSFFFPIFSTYFYSGVPLYIIFSIICVLIYLSILFPSFWQTLKQGDVYVFCVLQIIYIEAAYSVPLTYYYCDPFILDSLIFIARAVDSVYGETSFPFTRDTYEDLKQIYTEEEELVNRYLSLPYSELKPVPNELAPGQLYKIAVDRMFRAYNIENQRYISYFFKKYMHSNIRSNYQKAFQIGVWRQYTSLEDHDPVDRCMIWHSGMTPFKSFQRRYLYQHNDFGPAWSAYCMKSNAVRYGYRFFSYLTNENVKVIPQYMFELFRVPPLLSQDGRSCSRRFDRLVRETLEIQVEKINAKRLTKIRTFFENPRMISSDEKHGFYVYLRAQKKLGGIHLSPVLTENTFTPGYPYPGSSTYHFLFPSFTDYRTNKALKLLQTWSTFYSERYPINVAPLLELDTIFSNTRFLGLVVFFDQEDGERVFFGEKDEEIFGSRHFSTPNFSHSALQRDFSPTYNLDILEFINRLPGFEEQSSVLFQFSAIPDLNSSLAGLQTGFDVTSFKAFSMWGQKGLFFAPFTRFNFYQKFVDSQWYIFTKEIVYDPITGINYVTLGTRVWTWGLSQRWIRDARLVSVYTNTIGTGAIRRVPYPTRFFIPFKSSKLSSLSSNHTISSNLRGVQYDRPTFSDNQFYLPYMLDKWSEPSPVTKFEVVQNGYWFRKNEDSRWGLQWRHNSIIASMVFDSRAVEHYVFMPRFFDSPLHRPYSFVLHRSFDAYDWPRYMPNELKSYPRTSIKAFQSLLDTREPWEKYQIFINSGYHPRTPKILIHPDIMDSVGFGQAVVARMVSVYFTAYDKFFYFQNWLIGCFQYIPDRLNRRYLTYYINSQIQWGKRGKIYHPFDLWWNGYLNREYGYQVSEIRVSLWTFRFIEQMGQIGGGSMCYYQHQTDYYLKIAKLLSLYFDKYGLNAPPHLHNTFKAAAKHYNPPVKPFSNKIPSHVKMRYPNMVPKVLFELQEILDGPINIINTPGSRYSKVGPLHQAHIDKCVAKYPYERLSRQISWLLKSEKTENLRGTNQ